MPQQHLLTKFSFKRKKGNEEGKAGELNLIKPFSLPNCPNTGTEISINKHGHDHENTISEGHGNSSVQATQTLYK